MHARWTSAACLALMALLSRSATADPITGSIQIDAVGASYTAGAADLSTFPQNWVVPGGSLGPNVQSGTTWPFNSAPFEMDISFYGPSGNALVELNGTLSGTFTENASGSGFSGTVTGAPTTAALFGGLPGSGIPLALIDQYMNMANYTISVSIEGPNNQLFYSVTVNPSPEVSTPEPGALAAWGAALTTILLIRLKRVRGRSQRDRGSAEG
jgi:hypothetical protein